ncbi:Biogenesis of lysosome-related organelles complex 1 subunit KXD1 [Pleurostoma richardsiae]|uniref:Biogenesis of lysosome-related organelles complex 1 subunit KXD1 n=1 Tax=Pleurostoma richardsiae TaxID=41990 RepID=A0AA38RWM9_9PEZI|nr:Biogenesis of lysosome-related organelles complex 1 subunit KXD1 [Pleurostoma richardsiae]
MSSPYSTQYYSGTLPMPVPTKDQYPNYYQTDSTYSVSPPEGDASVSSGSGVPSYSNSGYSATASYAGSSHGDYDSAGSASGVDFNEYMHDRFAESFNPLPLDKAMAVQAQTSGKLNSKHRELLELQKQAQARLAKTRARFAEGMQDAREVRADLEWTQKKVTSLKNKAAKKHPKEYQKARARYPSPEY